jgi:acyl-CoA synthetase (AMP-forming)/AMP-acid ligase II
MNISYFLTNSANKFPDKIACISGERHFTYRDLNVRVNSLADAMRQSGVKKKDRVAVLMYNTHHFIEVYFAALKLGAVLVPINYRLTGNEIKYVIDNSEATAIFFGKEFRITIADIYKKLKNIRLFVGVGLDRDEAAHDYEVFLATGTPAEPGVMVVEDDPCQIIYTSGTTGKPKGAVITHRNIFWNLFNTTIGREHRAGEISLIIGPLFHTAALNNHMMVQIALGGTSILVKNFDPELILRCIEQEKVNVIPGSPTMFNLLLQFPGFDQFDTSSLTKCTSGSAILPEELKQRLLEKFPNIDGIIDLYGCTEASPTITTLSAKDSLRKKYSVGVPAVFVEARVVDEQGKPLPPNHVGELICRGPNIMQGYYKNEQATKEVIKNGWLYTGDLARADEEGYFYIVDRKKDMIVSGGENIYPREIEEVLFRHPAIEDVAVIGVPHSLWGETVKAYVVKKEAGKINAQEVIAYCKQRLASYKKPTIVEFIESIPKNAAGKPLKKILKMK